MINTCRKVPFQVNFLGRHFALVSILLIIPWTIEEPTNFVKFITGQYRIRERTYIGPAYWREGLGELGRDLAVIQANAGPTIIYLLCSTLL